MADRQPDPLLLQRTKIMRARRQVKLHPDSEAAREELDAVLRQYAEQKIARAVAETLARFPALDADARARLALLLAGDAA